jgi:hypothetical protein
VTGVGEWFVGGLLEVVVVVVVVVVVRASRSAYTQQSGAFSGNLRDLGCPSSVSSSRTPSQR